jgi:hypothetical protein
VSINLTFAQNDSIVGYAPDFIGKKVTLYTYDDYLTMTKVKLAEGEVSLKDSLFRLANPVKFTVKGIIEIDNTESELYIQPNQSYTIGYIKPENMIQSFVNQKVETVFYGLDSLDINYKVLQYDQWLDKYIYYHQLDIVKSGFTPYLDTFKMYAYQAYKDEKNAYFLNYVRYNIASMEQIKKTRKNENAKLNTYLEYIKPYPVFAYNDQYMHFIKSFFPKDFEGYMPDIKASIYLAIDHSSPTRLMKALGKNLFLKNVHLREMMMVRMLGNSYYKRGYNRANIITILDSVSHYATYKPNAIASKNMINYLTKIEQGYPAPQFTIVESNDTISIGKYNGKFLYINFFASWNQPSVNEMKLIKELKDKYGDYIYFLSLCTDKSKEGFETFITQHPNYNWDMVYIGEDSGILNQYDVKTIPAYFLINPEGFIALSPAKGPSPDGQYQSIENTFEYIASMMK